MPRGHSPEEPAAGQCFAPWMVASIPCALPQLDISYISGFQSKRRTRHFSRVQNPSANLGAREFGGKKSARAAPTAGPKQPRAPRSRPSCPRALAGNSPSSAM
ncbi:uncharacterized protein LOC144579163 [Callithrix jacchus]